MEEPTVDIYVSSDVPGIGTVESWLFVPLRDLFAAAALGWMITDNSCKGTVGGYSEDAYELADAMIAARQPKKEGEV